MCICSSVLSKVHEDIQNQMIYSNQCDWVKISYKEKKVFWENSNWVELYTQTAGEEEKEDGTPAGGHST